MKIKRNFTFFTVFAAVAALLAVTAFASVTFDPNTGTGFVGKGDVQLVLGLNNAQVQNTPVSFTYSSSSTTVTSYTWTCDRDSGPQTQERANVTTVTNSTQGIVGSLARVKNQITGFNLLGWNGAPTITSTSEHDGNPIGSCPDKWTNLGVTEESTTTPGASGLYVNGVLLQ
jgi:hypothetical protein